MEEKEVYTAAKAYLARGWSVMPINRYSKKPVLDWKEYQSRRATDEEAYRWFQDSDHNVGLVTGDLSGLCVLDYDPRHGGPESLEAVGVTIDGADVRTPSGGLHYYYRDLPWKPKNFSGKIPGIDFRGQGGYVLTPPSYNPVSRKGYTWLHGQIPGQLSPPGPVLSRLLAATGTRLKGPARSVPWAGRIGTYFSTLQPAQEGTRNESAAKLVGKLLYRGLPEERVVEIVRLWNSENDPPLDDAELMAVVRSIADVHRRNNGLPN